MFMWGWQAEQTSALIDDIKICYACLDLMGQAAHGYVIFSVVKHKNAI